MTWSTRMPAPDRDALFVPTSRRRLIVIGLVIASLLALVVAPFAFLMGGYGCRSSDTARAERLTGSAWLDVHPAGTAPVAGRDTGCEDDDRMAMAIQAYGLGGLTRQSVVEFYRQELGARGWRDAEEVTDPCWNHPLARGEAVSFAVRFPQDYGGAPGTFELELSSSPDGGGWCAE